MFTMADYEDSLGMGLLSNLVEFAALNRDYKVDYHVHTNYTDGKSSVADLAEMARLLGVREILFSEHVRKTSTYFVKYANEINNTKVPGVKLLVGAETKILDFEGNLDCSQKVIDLASAVVGSVHRPPKSVIDGFRGPADWVSLDERIALDIETRLALAIVIKSKATIIGHPLGMVVRHFDLRPEKQLLQIAYACKEHNKAFELNPIYCKDKDMWVDVVRKAKCKISLGSNAHSADKVGCAWNYFIGK